VKAWLRGGLLALCVLSGCEGKRPRAASRGPDSAATPLPPDSLPPMPKYPEPGRGRLAALSAGAERPIQGEWPAEAGICEQPPMLQVVSQVPGTGTIVLLALPEGNRVTSYPVALVGTGLPTPPAAQVGVQMFAGGMPAAYQASDGAVEIYAFEKTVSGRFGVTLRHISTNQKIRYAGAFKGIPLKALDQTHCALADSTARAR